MLLRNKSEFYYHFEKTVTLDNELVQHVVSTRVYTKGKAKMKKNLPIKRTRTKHIRNLGEIYYLRGYSLETAAALTTADTKESRSLVELVLRDLYD